MVFSAEHNKKRFNDLPRLVIRNQPVEFRVKVKMQSDLLKDASMESCYRLKTKANMWADQFRSILLANGANDVINAAQSQIYTTGGNMSIGNTNFSLLKLAVKYSRAARKSQCRLRSRFVLLFCF